MKFILYEDKIVVGERGTKLTFLVAGIYDVVRLFDYDRVMVATNHGRPRQVTLVRIKDGEFTR